MDWPRIGKGLARAAYTVVTLYAGAEALTAIEGLIVNAGREDLLVYVNGLQAAIIAASLVVRLSWLAMIIVLAWGLITGDPLPFAYLVAIAGLASIASTPLRGMRGWYRESAKRLPLVFLTPFTVYLLAAAPLAAAAYRLILFLEVPPVLPGELGTVNSLLYPTLMYRVVLSGLVLGVAYKAVSSFASLVEASASSPRMARAVLEYEVSQEAKPLVLFRGKQYPFLEWGVVAFMSLLAAPLIYRPIADAIVSLAGDTIPGVYAALLSLAVTLVASWVFLRFIAASLARQATLKYLLEPRPALPIVAGFIVAAGLLAVIVVAGANPVDVLVEAVTGNPQAGDDPIAGILDYTPPEDYYRTLAELIDLFARLLWGGG